MPYIIDNNRDPNDIYKKIKICLVLILVLFFLFAVYKTSFAFQSNGGLDENEMGYYCPPYSESVNDGDFVIFNSGILNCQYSLDNAPSIPTSGAYFGAIFVGTLGNSIVIGGHSLGDPCDDGTCSKLENDDWDIPSRYYDEDIFVAIYKTQDGQCISYFTNGSETCDLYGIYELKWGGDLLENDIDFTSPIGNLDGFAPFLLNWTGNYKIASSSVYWSAIQVELTLYSAPDYATTSIDDYYIALQNIQNYGLGNFDQYGYLVINGIYTYRARFVEIFYDYVASTSDWIYNNGAYWQFEVGETGSGMPDMDDYFATTSDFGILGNMFRDVLLWLFKPSSEVLNYWITLKDIIAEKPPFGYYVLIKENFDNLSSSNDPAFVLQTASPVLDYIFYPLKTGLSWILWILFGIWFIKRFIHFVI